jgi:uncharacterized protein
VTINRRQFLERTAIAGGVLATLSPFYALVKRGGRGRAVPGEGYGPLIKKGDLWLPLAFNYQVLSVQGTPMSDGHRTPGMFDGMAAFPAPGGRTILIRNHENRAWDGETRVTGERRLDYDPSAFGGNTKLVVERRPAGTDPVSGQPRYIYRVVRDFAILSGTSTNCAGGIRHPHTWISCEEVVNASDNGIKHGYIFEVDARSERPVPAVPIRQAGRRAHEAAAERNGMIYMTEDRSVTPDSTARRRLIGACFYRYGPVASPSLPLASTACRLEALKLRNEFQANMNDRRISGTPYPVEWVVVEDPDHDDDSDDRRDRVRGYTPNRIQAQDKGAAFFNRLEGLWVGPGDGKIYFTATSGGPSGLGQVWQYDADREEVTLIYESVDADALQNPDNITVVPATQDLLICEDGSGSDFIRGLTTDGEIFDFLRTTDNTTELCGACFDPAGHTLYVNQQGARGSLPHGPRNSGSVTYAIYGPFDSRRRGSIR